MAREAYSLRQLETEIQEFYPGTTTWEKGDANHQASFSDHNENKAGVYCAKDILDNGGMNLAEFVRWLTANPHPNLRYVIYKDKIYHRRDNFEPKEYTGKYHKHVHVSVGNGPDGRSTSGYDNRASWGIANLGKNPTPVKPSKPTTQGWTDKLMAELPEVSRNTTGRYVNVVQALLNISGAGLAEDGKFGDHTERETKEYQRKHGLTPDGVVGKRTWPVLIKGK
jgi:hypothetical protein